jgi:DNA segregation ATPase FtsK/SpoIIIE, S-DNA-T family
MPDPQPRNISQYLMILPMLAGAAAMAMMMMSRVGTGSNPSSGNNTMRIAMGAMMGISMVGMMATSMGGNRAQKKAEFNADRRD